MDDVDLSNWTSWLSRVCRLFIIDGAKALSRPFADADLPLENFTSRTKTSSR